MLRAAKGLTFPLSAQQLKRFRLGVTCCRSSTVWPGRLDASWKQLLSKTDLARERVQHDAGLVSFQETWSGQNPLRLHRSRA